MNVLPTSPAERRRVLVGLLTLGLLGALFVWIRRPAAAPVQRASNAVAVRTPATAAPPIEPDPVRLDGLDVTPVVTDFGRNPFQFGTRAAPPAAPAPVRAAAPVMPVATLPPQPAGPPPIALTFIVMTRVPGGDRILATLRDPATGAVYQAFEGDIVDGRYRVTRVTADQVVVTYLDGSGSRTIRLGG